MKNIIEAFKDPKKRALVQLGAYFIFFAFVFILLNMSNNNSDNYNDNNTSDVKENNDIVEAKNSNIKSYSYIHVIDDVEIKGTYVDNQNIYEMNNIKYYNYNNKTYLYNEMKEVEYFNIEKYSYESIEELIDNSEFVEKTTYKDNTEKTTYIINNDSYCINCNMIVESNKYINKVIIGDNIELNYMEIS